MDEHVHPNEATFAREVAEGDRWQPAPIVEGEPVLWSAGPGGKTIVVSAKAEHGLVFEGRPIDGTVTLRPDTDEHPDTVTARVTVKTLDDAKGHATFETACLVNGKTVVDGEALIMVPRRT